MPDELLITILGFLTHREKLQCGRVCQLLRRVAADQSLWQTVSLTGCRLNDEALKMVGERAGYAISLDMCHGISVRGIDLMARGCGDTLRTLNLRCSHVVTDDSLKLLAAQCRALQRIDLSWCRISDTGVLALCRSRSSPEKGGGLELVRLQGCSQVRNYSAFCLVGCSE